MNTKLYLDELVKKYETKDFIKDDPIQFPHRFSQKDDIEIAGFLASIFAYGKRELFIKKLNILFEIMNNSPHNYILNFTREKRELENFDYRFSIGIDLEQIILILKQLYTSGESLESLFKYGWEQSQNIQTMQQIVVDYFYARITLPISNGFFHLLPNPSKNSACKRINMFLRWMVRDGQVDLGVWKFLPKSELLIPLDTHVAKISREINLLERKQNDYNAVIELTNKLKEFSPEDPTKYDFAMFGFGVNTNS